MADEAGATNQTRVFVQKPIDGVYKKPYQSSSPSSSTYPISPSPIQSDVLAAQSIPPLDALSTSRRSFINPQSAWEALGERLNINSGTLETPSNGDIEMRGDISTVSQDSSKSEVHMPFALKPGSRRLEQGESIPHIPHTVSLLSCDIFPSPCSHPHLLFTLCHQSRRN